MILDHNDPTGLGLFSRYARNHACKSTKNRPKTANNPRNQDKGEQNLQKQNKRAYLHKSQFDMQESRAQREVRYRKQSTPAVGQYNPVLKQRPKMVIDILKIYHSKHKSRLGDQSFKQSSPILVKSKGQAQQIQFDIHTQPQNHRADKLQRQGKLSTTQNHQSLNHTHQHHKSSPNQTEIQKYNGNNHYVQGTDNREDHESRVQKRCRYQTMKTQGYVDMSRMTGRGEFSLKNQDFNQSLNLDTTNSMNIIKKKNAINISFDKQISRERANRDYKTASHDYNYDYTVVKPNKVGIVKFNKTAGRYKKDKPWEGVYSYLHYDFDEYVWNKKSQVFPNTKTHVVDFSRQPIKKS